MGLAAAVEPVQVGAYGIQILIGHLLADKAQVTLECAACGMARRFFQGRQQLVGQVELGQLGGFEVYQTTTQGTHLIAFAFELRSAGALVFLFLVVEICHFHLIATRRREQRAVTFNAP